MDPFLNRYHLLFDLEDIGKDVFRSSYFIITYGHIYGGHLIAHAIVAAQKTVSKHLYVNSSHSHFIKIGLDAPVTYCIQRLQDSNKFALRRVDAFQNNTLIFSSQISFHNLEESFLEHHLCKMPVVRLPEESPSFLTVKAKPGHPLTSLSQTISVLMDVRLDDIQLYKKLKSSLEPEFLWIKTKRPLRDSDDLTFHHYQVIVAFMSDYETLPVLFRPHSPVFKSYALSITHTLWFHSSFDLEDWILFHRKTPVLENNIGFIQGSLWTSSGKLVASICQEGLIRRNSKL